MKLMLDSADTSAWRDLIPTGLFSAITTNPLLVQRAGLRYDRDTFETLLATASDLGVDELQIQTIGATPAEMVSFAQTVVGLAPDRVVVKLPLTRAGIQAAAQLRAVHPATRLTMTACYAAKQMLVAAALDADYIAPYYGRLLESGKDADRILESMGAMSRGKTKILVASLRSAQQVVALAARGFDSFTLAPAVAETLLSDPASEQATADFEAAASSIPAR